MKNNAVIKTLSVVLVLVLLAAAGWKTLPFARAEQYNVGDAEITVPVRNLDVSWTSGKVHIAYHSGSTVRISEKTTGTVTEDMRMRWRMDGDTLRIEYEKPGFHLFSFFPHEKELTVTLPQGLTLQTANISLTSGQMNVPALYAENVTLNATSGEILGSVSARNVTGKLTSGVMDLKVMNTAEEIMLKSTSGSIALESTGADKKITIDSTSGSIRASVGQVGEFKVESTSGDVYAVIGQAKKAELKSTSGNVIVKIAALETLDAHSTSGGITAYLPAASGFTARLESTSGHIDHELPLTQSDKDYVCGDGSASVKIHTTSGNILVKAWEN